jgi:hypothetical protein
MLLALIGGNQANAEDNEILQLRRQLSEQRQYMEAMEKRLLDLEGKEKERTSSGLEAGYNGSNTCF